MGEQTVGLGGNGATVADSAKLTKTKKERGTVTADRDLTAMAKISGIINSLGAIGTPDRKRVVAHIVEKYGSEVK